MPRPRQNRQNLYPAFMIAIWFLVCVLSIYCIIDILGKKRLYLNAAIIESKAQAQLLGENTSGTLYNIDLTLSSLASHIQQNDLKANGQKAKLRAHVQNALVLLPEISELIISGADRTTAFSLHPSHPLLPTRCFDHHKDAWAEFCLDSAILGNGEHRIILSRRIDDSGGRFTGTITAWLDPIFFHERYQSYLNPDARSVMLLDQKNQTITKWNKNMTPNSDGANDISLFKSLPRDLQFVGGIKTHETETLLLTLYQLSAFPYKIAVIHEKNKLFAEWHRQKNRLFLILGAAIAFGIFTQIAALAATARKRKAEEDLSHYHKELESIIKIRTHRLAKTNEALYIKIDENTRTENQLRESREQYRQIYNSISDCLIITDTSGHIIDVNPAACKTYGYSRKEFIGSHVRQIIHENFYPAFEKYREQLIQTGQYQGEVLAVRKDGSHISTFVRGTSYSLKGQQIILAVVRDITAEKENLLQRENLISELQKALEEIKTLKGIVPICSNCKKIRDDSGYWNLLETYIEKHSEASFSHGICPECSEQLYGKEQWFIAMKKENTPPGS